MTSAQSLPRSRGLTPEEDSIGDPEDEDDIDDTLPGDLWFRARPRGRSRAMPVY